MQLTMPAGLMDFIAVVIGAIFLGGGIVRLLFWNRRGNRPQAITLYTAQTPDQVVRQDISNLVGVIVKAVIVGIGIAFAISTIIPPP